MTSASSLVGAALLGFGMGAMLGGSALGVVHAAAMPPPPWVPAATNTTLAAMQTPSGHQDDEDAPDDSDDTDETASDGDAGADPSAVPTTRRAARAPARNTLDSAFYHVQPGPVTGYRDGHPLPCVVTMVDGKPVEVRTASAFERMRSAAARAGIAIRVISGFRTMEHQRALYAAYRAGRGHLAALPGHSNHQSGHALDLNVTASGVLNWLERHARDFGFRRTVPHESWHWEHW